MKMKEINGKWYSRHSFSTYERRAVVLFTTIDDNERKMDIYFTTIDDNERKMDIYTTETDKDLFIKGVESMVTSKVKSFKVDYWVTKKQDDGITELLNETLKGI